MAGDAQSRIRQGLVIAGLAALLLFLNLALNAVLFLPGERIHRGTIEPGYVSMARFVAEHPNPWGWKPENYCGLPAWFAYLPVLPYLTASATWLSPGLAPEQAYRLITVGLACLGPITVFLLVFHFTRARWWALAAATTHTLFSPMYILVERLSLDAGIAQLPARLHAQIKYGEAPHNLGLTLLPLALMAVHAAARTGGFPRILLAAITLAAIALINWVAALALALCCVLLLLSYAGTFGAVEFQPKTLAATGALGYLLVCFWLTPSLIATIALNWPVDALNYQLRTQEAVFLLSFLAGIIVLRALFLRWPREAYLCFLSLAAFSFSFLVLGYYWLGIETIPEARRYVPEADLFVTLLYFELARRALTHRRHVFRIAVLAVALLTAVLGVRQVWRYIAKPRLELTPFPKENTAEYQVASFLAGLRPHGRVFVTGGTRFRLNSWFPLPQAGGTFESALENRTPEHFRYQIVTGEGATPDREGAEAVMQLRTLGVEYVAVHGPDSSEFYKDFRSPAKFDGLLEPVYNNQGDVVYRVPFRSYATLVLPAELPEAVPTGSQAGLLAPLMAAMDDPARPGLITRWDGPNQIEISGDVPEGMVVWISMTWHHGWTARQNGWEIPLSPDVMGFTIAHPNPGQATRIVLAFDAPLEPKIAAAASALTWIACLAGLWLTRRRGPRNGTPP